MVNRPTHARQSLLSQLSGALVSLMVYILTPWVMAAMKRGRICAHWELPTCNGLSRAGLSDCGMVCSSALRSQGYQDAYGGEPDSELY